MLCVWCFRVLCGVMGYCGEVLLSLWSKVVEFCGVLWWSVVGLLVGHGECCGALCWNVVVF